MFNKLDREGRTLNKMKTKNRPLVKGANAGRPPEDHITVFNRYKTGEIAKGTAIRLMGGYRPYYSFLKWLANQPKPKPPGRNEPCTCGSGKKFKKCCINVVKNAQNKKG